MFKNNICIVAQLHKMLHSYELIVLLKASCITITIKAQRIFSCKNALLINMKLLKKLCAQFRLQCQNIQKLKAVFR